MARGFQACKENQMAIYNLAHLLPDIHHDSWVAPSADLIGDIVLKKSASVWFGAVLRGDNEKIIVGDGSNVQDGCVLHTDVGAPLTISSNCTIGHRVILHGCIVGEQTLVGMGAIILNRAQIGARCLIGAQALVTEGKVIPDGSLVMGSPGRVVRMLTEAEQSNLLLAALGYQRNWRRYQVELRSP